jgi:hypothetical protein
MQVQTGTGLDPTAEQEKKEKEAIAGIGENME